MNQNIQPLFGPARKEKPGKFASLGFVAVWVTFGLFGCGNSNLILAYCQLGHQCENDLLVGSSEDSIEVCRIHIENDHKRLDANSEAICGDIKTAHLDYMTCVITTQEEANTEAEQCDGLNLIFSPCHNERNTWYNLVADAGNQCDE